MKFTLSWLKEHLDTTASLDEIVEKLTAIGLEVEEVVNHAEVLKDFTVAEILKAEPHPNADKLKKCVVDNGKEKLQIVCGASNARDGIKVVLASIGTVIPTNGMRIKKSKIRDVESNGMLCSADELGVGADSAGIIELPGSAKVGEPFAKSLGLDDPVIEIAITPNRGDCLGVRGIARDLAAAGLGHLKEMKFPETKGKFSSDIDVKIKDKKKAPMFIGRHIKGVKNGPSPEWLAQRLESVGVGSISMLVDITNFLTLDLGRPAHVYDASKLKGNLEVRDAKKGEKIAALNDKEYELEAGMTVIADDSGPVAIGGVIGSKPTGCSDDTKDVFLEIALFDPITVAETGRKLQIDSDARYRFERTVDMGFVKKGADRATGLILDLCGGEASEYVIAGKEPNWQKTIKLRVERVKNLIGIEPSVSEIKHMLQEIGCTVYKEKEDKIMEVDIPSWRNDLEIEEDLIEEVARLYGYDNIPTLPMPHIEDIKPALNAKQKRVFDMKRGLSARGLKEAVTYSFMSAKDAKFFNEGAELIEIANPISADLDVMRPSILPNLLSALARNQARGRNNLALFESGSIFEEAKVGAQKLTVSGIRAGKSVSKNHYGDERDVDAFDAKADVFAILSEYIPTDNLNITRDVKEYYHPGRSGAVLLGKNVLAYFGEIHPNVLSKMNVKGIVVGFEVFPDNLPEPKEKKSFARSKLDINNLQAVDRDFAFVVDDFVTAGEILKAVKKSDKELIDKVSIFDVYAGKNIEDGKKSVAITVRLQPKEATLTDEEIEKISSAIVGSVEKSVGGTLRDSA